ncbi:hypothetical protein CKF59_02355 [Psittacicella gerlachiana]|uniref:N-acetyltransferase domain-containing protein n=2 Tax=Psittacicella gerlachiana TaxID=2028574 RepID=A0A3A1YHN9_9GAMM|nr:hypothetical protein CKF59_02355 [Psittacicella gerlachiana]
MLEVEFELFYDFVQTYLAEVLEVTLLVLEGKLLQVRERAWLIPAWDNFQGEVNKKFYQQELGVNQLVGFICFEAQFEMLNLDNITINPDFRKCGFAQLLLDLMFAFGRWQETTNYLLEVRESNTPAIALYQKNKFRLINKRYSYYRNSLNGQAEDALIYQLLLE